MYLSSFSVLATTLLLSNKVTLQSSVSLTVEGGVSLVGPHCPGTVRLFCEGVELTVLMWRYNGTNGIEPTFVSDTTVSTLIRTSNPAFESVQLTAVSSSIPTFANFSSTLTVVLSQLEQQNIRSVSCGDALFRDTVPIDIEIKNETIPVIEAQTIMANIAHKTNSVVITVEWKPPATECTEFSERISYEITLMFAETNFTITANNSICTPLSRCDAVFVHRGFTGRNFTVYLRAVNSVGKSNISTYSDVILDLCDPPMSPVNGSVSGQSSLCPPGSEVTYHCNSGLFPTGVMTSTCTDVGGRGEWVPDPGQLVCSNETKVTCSVIAPPENGKIDGLHGIDTSSGLSVGTTVVFLCNRGYSPAESINTTCNSSGEWSIDTYNFKCIVESPVSTTSESVIEFVTGGIGGFLLVIVGVVILVIIGAAGRARYKYKHRTIESEMIEQEEFYNELNHQTSTGIPTVVTTAQTKFPVLDVDHDTVYDRIAPSTNVHSQSMIYSEVAASLNRTTSTAKHPIDQHQVNYSTVDIEATCIRAKMVPNSPEENQVEDLTMAVDKLLDLDQCLGQLKGVQSKWREFGEALFVPSTYIEQIEAHYTSDAAAGLTEVIDYWIRNCSGQPTWRELANALRLVGESNLAKEFLEIYETGELPVRLNFEEVPDSLYKYDSSPPPPIPARVPSNTLWKMNEATMSPPDVPLKPQHL